MKVNLNENIHRGDVYYADLSPVTGSEQGGIRPVLVVQNDVGNKFSRPHYQPHEKEKPAYPCIIACH